MRVPVIAGNWKMYKTGEEAVAFVEELKGRLGDSHEGEIVVCPPFTALEAAARAAAGSQIQVGAQHMHWEEEGAFTGEVSPRMLVAAGCRWVIIGHSERRQYNGETDALVNRRLRSALRWGLVPIFCLGETLPQRQAGETREVCFSQLEQGLQGVSEEEVRRVVIAYEPVWAIGTGKNATPEDAQEMIGALRQRLGELFSMAAAERVRILYGGSVRPDNIVALMSQPDVDGVLVGGASLQVESFAVIAADGIKCRRHWGGGG